MELSVFNAVLVKARLRILFVLFEVIVYDFHGYM